MTLFPVHVDVYHKEQLVTREEAKEAAFHRSRWIKVAVNKDISTSTRIADILDKYGFNHVAGDIRGKCVCVYYRPCINTVQDSFEKAQLS